MCNTFIPIATLPTAVLRTPLQIPGRTPGLLSEQTSKRPIATLPSPVVRSPGHAEAFCQNRQASAPSLRFVHQPLPWTDAGPFVRTDKQAPCKQRVSEPIAGFPTATLCAPAAAVSWARPGKLLSEQTSKQLSTGCSQFVVSYPQVTAE